MRSAKKDGFNVLGLGVAACVACCAGPILAVLGGVSLAGIASTWLIGASGLIVAAMAAVGFVLVRRRQTHASCATDPVEPAPIELTARRASR